MLVVVGAGVRPESHQGVMAPEGPQRGATRVWGEVDGLRADGYWG